MKARHQVATSDQLPNGGRLVVDVGAITIGVFRVNGRLYAYENTCPHQGGPVCQGLLIPGVIENIDGANVSTGFSFDESDARIVCPWHGFEFRIVDGCHPAKASIRLRAVAVEEDEQEGAIYVAV
jgi:nitrite reductase/ring-hydroxylating ferredoxin subunit